ncbi:MAG: TSUP family transporter, partial [Gammaproteobacteria bacterium]|nr:TSUP family transporter [Gammaproteobacteria bacterium]
FFGIGTGPSMVLAFSVLRGYELRLAVSNSRLVMMVIHSSSLLILMAGGHVWWLIAICMALGNIAGSYFGAQLLIKSGHRLIKALLVIVPLASAIKLLFFN